MQRGDGRSQRATDKVQLLNHLVCGHVAARHRQNA